MTTIGYATLQLIPSLLNVTEEIEKQLPKKPIEVPVAPKVDQAAAKKAGQEAGATVAKEAKTAAAKTPVAPTVDKTATARVGKEAGESITKEAKTAVQKGDIGKLVSDDITQSVKKSSPGKDLAKLIVDGVAEGAKQEIGRGGLAEVIVDGLAEGVKQGIEGEGVGGKIVDVIGDGVKSGNLGGTIKDAVLPTIKNIGTEIKAGAAEWAHGIGDSLRSGDIQSATNEIATAVQNTTNLIGGIGDALGVQTTVVQQFGGEIATGISHIGDTAKASTDQVNSMITPLQNVAGLAGPDSKLYQASEKLPLVGALVSLVPVMRDANAQLETMVQKYTGLNIPLSGESWVRYITNNRSLISTAEDDANAAKDAAVAAAQAAGPPPPVQRGPAFPGDNYRGPGRAGGGMIPGFSKTDNRIGVIGGSTPIGLAGGEFIVNADATRKSLPLLEIINSGRMSGFAAGGLVSPNQLSKFASGVEGKPYVRGGVNWGDCSGAVSAIANFATGRAPFGSRFATATESAELAARGFKSGTGPAGSLNIGWYNGGPGGGHTAATLPDGTNFEMGGRRGNGQFGGGAAGANDSEFTSRAFLPPEFFSGLDGGAPTRGGAGASPVSGGGGGSSGGGLPTPSSGGTGGGTGGGGPVSSSSGGGGFSLPSTISGLAGFGLDGLGPKTKAGPNSPERTFDLGGVAADAIGGQVSSALGVFGIGDAPPFLNALSTLVGGISVGGNSAAPTSASSTSGGTPPPDGAGNLGASAGQSGPTYNIQSRDTEDAFIRAQRIDRERTAAKLSVY